MAWDAYDTISGTKYIMQNGLRRMDESVPFEILQHLDGEGAELAQECYMVSVAFAHGLITFIDMFYLDMCNSAGFNEKEAWELTTAVVVKIFSDRAGHCAPIFQLCRDHSSNTQVQQGAFRPPDYSSLECQCTNKRRSSSTGELESERVLVAVYTS
jgi:hypothetical protein